MRGEDWCSMDAVYRILEATVYKQFPLNRASVPIYSDKMAIDGNTRVGGVGDYTLRAASGQYLPAEKDPYH